MKRVLLFFLFYLTLISSFVQAEIYKIGVVGPFNGIMANSGIALLEGAKMAISHINAYMCKTNSCSIQFKLVKGNDLCNVEQAVQIAKQLVATGAKAVIGHVCSKASIAASKIYNYNKIIQISPATTNPQFTDQNLPMVFRMCGRDDNQGKFIGRFIKERLGVNNVAIIHDEQTYGKGLAKTVYETIQSLHGQYKGDIVLYKGINHTEKDLFDLIKVLRRVGAELIFFGGHYQQAAIFVRQLRMNGINSVFYGGDTLAKNAFVRTAQIYSNGVLFSYHPDMRNAPSAAKVVANFRKQGHEPDGITLMSYAATKIVVAELIESQGNALQAAKKMKNNKFYHTIIGEISFDSKGDIKNINYVPYVWAGQNYFEIFID